MQKAELMNDPSAVIEGFDLDEYIKAGEFQFPLSDKPIKLKIKIHNDAAMHLYETPLSEDQKIKKIEGDYSILTATVLDTFQLRTWLLGFGELVKILEPKEYI